MPPGQWSLTAWKLTRALTQKDHNVPIYCFNNHNFLMAMVLKVFSRKKNLLNSEQLGKMGKLVYIIDLKPISNIRRHQLENGLSVSILMEISITGFSYSSVYESLNPKDIIHCRISISAKSRGLTGCNRFFSKYCWPKANCLQLHWKRKRLRLITEL